MLQIQNFAMAYISFEILFGIMFSMIGINISTNSQQNIWKIAMIFSLTKIFLCFISLRIYLSLSSQMQISRYYKMCLISFATFVIFSIFIFTNVMIYFLWFALKNDCSAKIAGFCIISQIFAILFEIGKTGAFTYFIGNFIIEILQKTDKFINVINTC